MFPVIFAVDGNRAGMMLRMSCARRDASRDQIGVAGILTNDGRRCGSHENFQSLLGSRGNWVAKNLVANAYSRKWGRENLGANG